MRRGWIHGSFARRLTAVALLASGMALATLSAAFLLLDSISSRAARQNRLSTLADIVGQNSTAALDFRDSTAAVEVLEALRAEAPITSACLYDGSGELFAGYRREQAFAVCPPMLAQVPAPTRNHLSLVRPILHRGEPAGTLYLTSDLQDLQRRRWRLLELTGGLLLAALVVGGVGGSLLQ
jgi:uncharacterized membrane protein affecting hemolysin expression